MHGSLVFLRGQIVDLRGRRYQYVHRNPDGGHVFTDLDTHLAQTFVDAELIPLFSKREINVFPLRPTTLDEGEEEHRRFLRAQLEVDRDLRLETYRRLDYVQAWDQAGDHRVTPAALKPIIAAVFAARQARLAAEPPAPETDREAEFRKAVRRKARPWRETEPGASTVAKWIARWLAEGRDIVGLIPLWHAKGHKGDRLTPEQRDIVEEAIDRKYLQLGEPPLTIAYEHARLEVRDRNAVLPPDEHLVLPSIRTFARHVQRRVDTYTLMASRQGKREADMALAPKGSGPIADRVNDVWEIDHTELTRWIVEDEETGVIVGHPWITTILDRCSCAPLALQVGFDPPGFFPTFAAMRKAFLPKDYVATDFPEVTGVWPCFGWGRAIVPDNANEFTSIRFVEPCKLLKMDIQYAQIAKPYYKGRLERFFRTLQGQCRSVPGAKFSDYYKKNRKTVPDRVSVITLRDLDMLLHKWVIDVYLPRPHRRFGNLSPLRVWQNSVQVHGLVPPPDRDFLESVLSLTEWGPIHHYGIEYLGLRYNSAALANLAIAPGAPREFRFTVDLDDIGTIKVFDPEGKRFIAVPVVSGQRKYAAGVKLHTWKVARAVMRNDPARFDGVDGMAEALRFVTEFAAGNMGKGPQYKRRRLARHVFKGTQRATADNVITPPDADLRPLSEELSDALDGTPERPGDDPGDLATGQATAPDAGASAPDGTTADHGDGADLDAEAKRLGITIDYLKSGRSNDEQ